MSSDEQLSRLLAAERAEQPAPQNVAQGLLDLRHALGANLSALSVAHGPLKLGSLLATLKWSVISGALVFTALSASYGRAPAPPAALVTAAPARASASPTLAAPPAAATAEPELLELPAPSTLPAPARAAASASSSGGTGTFSEELRSIKLAKQLLDAGRDGEALARLQEHARLYPHGVFAGERDALVVLVQCRTSSAAGRRAALSFLQQYPASPFGDRLSRACGLEAGAAPSSGKFPESSAGK